MKKLHRPYRFPTVNPGSGFTLVEIVITVGTAIFAVVGILHLLVYCVWLNQTSSAFTSALSEAYGKLERIQSTPYDDILARHGTNGVKGTPFNIRTLGGNGKGVVYFDSTNPDLLRLEVVVSWQEGNNSFIGEDRNLNGVLDSDEDMNGNGKLDSPASLVTLIAER